MDFVAVKKTSLSVIIYSYSQDSAFTAVKWNAAF